MKQAHFCFDSVFDYGDEVRNISVLKCVPCNSFSRQFRLICLVILYHCVRNHLVGNMFLNHATPEQQIHIQKVLNEDPRTRGRDLEALKEWLRQQPHLPDTFDEERLMSFLRYCKFSMEKTKRKLDMYFTVRAAVPEFFTNRDINRPELQEILKLGRWAIMPNLTPNGTRITVAAATHTDFNTPNINDLFKLVFMMGDVRLKAERVGVLGDIYVLDASVAVLKHFVNVSPVSIKKFLTCAQEAYPNKFREIHIVNATPFVDFVLKTVTGFLKEKLRERIHLHASYEELHEFVPKELLPEEFGGTAGKTEEFMKPWLEAIEAHTEWFKEQEKVTADESKRPGKALCFEELFGLDGSFRQLAID